MEPPLIELDNGWKKFSKTVPSNRKRLSRSIMRSALGLHPSPGGLGHNEYWALEEIYLSLDRGQSVGLIGRNGAGKSTLLQVLAGHFALERGELTMRGRVAELINLTAGFQPLLSGRENIRLGCLLRGLTPVEVNDRIEEIIDFAEIEEFIEAPYATYSLGMKMRLAFSVNIHTDPDVLLIDEVIGVGDLAFRQKCMNKMEDLRDRCAIVLCSHSTSLLSRFCEFGVILERGKMVFAGAAQDAVQVYLESTEETKVIAPPTTVPAAVANADPVTPPALTSAPPAPKPAQALDEDTAGHAYSNADIVRSVTADWCNGQGDVAASYDVSDTAILRINASFHPDPERETVRFAVFLMDRDGNRVGHTAVRARPSLGGKLEVELKLELETMANGHYLVDLRIFRQSKVIYKSPIEPLLINRARDGWGPVVLNGQWSVIRPVRSRSHADH